MCSEAREAICVLYKSKTVRISEYAFTDDEQIRRLSKQFINAE